MVPKFRGGSDDWLDNEKLIKKRGKVRTQQKKKKSSESAGLTQDHSNATVVEVFQNQCRVKLDENFSLFLCSYRRAEVFNSSQSEIRERTPVAVGDRVLVERTSESSGVIQAVCLRRNSLSRPAPGRDAERFQHVLAANVDQLLIVVSCKEPEFSLGIVDRFLVAAESEGIPAAVCVTKMDLMTPENTRVWNIYKELNYPVFELSVRDQIGLQELEDFIRGKTVVFCGQSGVGKTSLLRAILKSDVGKVNTVSEFTGKGRHTTTGAVLLKGPENSNWIDTPGVREFGLKVSPQNLAHCFPEFKDLSCKVNDCLHQDEQGCNAIHLARYPSYRRILQSLLAGEN